MCCKDILGKGGATSTGMNISIVYLGKYNCFWYFYNTHLNERVGPDIGEIKSNENIKMYKNYVKRNMNYSNCSDTN